MTIKYLDPEFGNDANDGSTFALRKQTLGSASASTVAGDEVRMIASLPPQSLGNATWTSGSGTVTLAAAKTLTIDNCETAWTSAGVTGWTIAAAVSPRKQGTDALSVTKGATAVQPTSTQLIAYKALGSAIDMSAYQCISLWWNFPTVLVTGASIRLALCSDTAGAVPIVSLQLPTKYNTLKISTDFVPVLLDNGAPLPTNVQSIALYVDIGGLPFAAGSAGTFYFDNIIACLPPGSAGHLSHGCVIGKRTSGEPEWHSIQSIDGVTIALGCITDITGVGTPKYFGVTETVTTYALRGLQVGPWAAADCTFNVSSSNVVNPALLTGGWDRTGMTTQSGESWIDAQSFYVTGLDTNTNPGKKIGPLIGVMAAATAGVSVRNAMSLDLLGIVNCVAPASSSSTGIRALSFGNIGWCGAGLDLGAMMQQCVGVVRWRRLYNSKTTGVTFSIGSRNENRFHNDLSIDGSVGGAIAPSGNGTGGRIIGGTYQNNSATVTAASLSPGEAIELVRPTLLDTTLLTGANADFTLRLTAVGGNRADNRLVTAGCTIDTVQTPVHGTAANTRRVTLTTLLIAPDTPLNAVLAKVACPAGKLVTVTGWVQRTTLNNTGGLAVVGGPVAGVSDSAATSTAAINTWDMQTLTFTPTEDGVVTVYGQIIPLTVTTGGITYFSDLTVTIAP